MRIRIIELTILFLFTVVINCSLFAQEPDPYKILDQIKINLEQINDYTADVEIEVDVDFINMPVKHATIFFKSPDKVKFKSKEFFMLPKRGINNKLNKLLEEEYSAIYTGQEQINGQQHHVIKIVPLSKKPEIILATWWIDTASYQIKRTESNTRDEGTFVVDMIYDNLELTLPKEIVVSFEIEKMKLPMKFIGKTAGMEIDKDKMKDKQNGKVFIRFSNYIINSNLADELFIPDDVEKENK